METVDLARGFEAICAFVNDTLDRTYYRDFTATGCSDDRPKMRGV